MSTSSLEPPRKYDAIVSLTSEEEGEEKNAKERHRIKLLRQAYRRRPRDEWTKKNRELNLKNDWGGKSFSTAEEHGPWGLYRFDGGT